MPADVRPLYTNAAGWNQWVMKDAPDGYALNNTVCDATTSANNVRHTDCVHGGEIRAVALAGRTACTGLSATDSLSAFEWSCRVLGGCLRDGWRLRGLCRWRRTACNERPSGGTQRAMTRPESGHDDRDVRHAISSHPTINAFDTIGAPLWHGMGPVQSAGLCAKRRSRS